MLDSAIMITAEASRDAAVQFRTLVTLEQDAEKVVSALLEATAHGVYECEVNGQLVTSSVLNPGWTSYEWRLQVQQFEVTEIVASSEDRTVGVTATLGNGWWRGDLGFGGANANYGAEIGFIAQLTILYEDGTEQVVGTDETSVAYETDITANNLYNGQTIDARLRHTEAITLPVSNLSFDRSTLVQQTGPPIVRNEVLNPVAVVALSDDRVLVDFGQNLVGWIRLTATGREGQTVTIRHAEVLDQGELATVPLRGAKATDRYILSGESEVFEPTFTFHGFRYAEVSGLPYAEVAAAVQAVVVHSDMARTGWFECSHHGINQLVQNSIWGQKGNFLDLPTDCPQRDERLGWTGDVAVFAPTAAFQFDVADFLHKWLLDVANEAADGGAVPLFVPMVMKYSQAKTDWDDAPPRPFAIWSDAAVWVPHALWKAYGDRDRLAAHYPLMKLHIETVQSRLSDRGVWEGEFQLGDWLDPTAPPDNPGQAKADPGVVATAALYRTLTMAIESAQILKLDDDERRWSALASTVRAGFQRSYAAADGKILSDCATVYSLAIVFGLLDEPLKAKAGQRLAELVRAGNYTVTTGFAGTPYVTWALSETGHLEDAYHLLLEESRPSWLYPVGMGATTIWERWDSMLPDGSINSGEMTSFNHYAFGSVVDWLYKVVAGIQPQEPGYTTVRLAPAPGPGLDWARAWLDTRHGRVGCGWTRVGDNYEITTEIPEAVVAELVLPDGRIVAAAPGTHGFMSGPRTVAG